MAGFFFCLASAEGAGLFFCPAKIQPNTSVYSAFCSVHASYTTHATKQCTRLYRRFSGYLPCFAAIVWRCIQLYHTACATLDARTLCRPAQPPYYNKVYKGAAVRPAMDPCQTVQQIADHASPAGSAPAVCGSLASTAPGAPAEGSASPSAQGQPGGLRSGTGSAVRAHPPPGGTVQQQGRGAEPLAALAAALFGLSPDS